MNARPASAAANLHPPPNGHRPTIATATSTATATAAAAFAALVAASLLALTTALPAAATAASQADVAAQSDSIPWLPGPVAQLGGAIHAIAVDVGGDASGNGPSDIVWLAHGPRLKAVHVALDGGLDVLGESEPLGGVVADIAVDGDLAVAVIEDMDRLIALDIADPLAPTVLASVALTNTAGTIALHGGFAYTVRRLRTATATGSTFSDATVAIVDVRDLDRPRVVALDALGPGRRKVSDVAVVGDLLAVASRGGSPTQQEGSPKLDVYAFQPDGSLTWLGMHDEPRWKYLAPGPAGSNTVFGGNNDVIAADLTDPSAPREIGRWRAVDGGCDCGTLAVSAAGRPYVRAGVRVSDVVSAALVGLPREDDDPATVDVFVLGHGVAAMAFAGDHLVVAGPHAELGSFRTSPRLAQAALEPRTGPLVGPPIALAIVERGNRALMHAALDGTSLATFALDDPLQPTLLGRAAGDGGPDTLAATGGFAIVSRWGVDDESPTYEVFDVTAPGTPVGLGTIGSDVFVARMEERDGGVRAWLGGWIVDPEYVYTPTIRAYSLPPTPSRQPDTTITLNLDLADFAIDGDRLVAVGFDPFTAGDARVPMLEVWDIANPQTPVHRSTVRLGGPRAKHYPDALVVLDGRHAYVARPTTGDGSSPSAQAQLLVVDLTDPAAPRVVTNKAQPSAIHGLTVADGLLFLLTECGPPLPTCVEVVDVRQPSAPRTVGAYLASAVVRDALAVHRGRLYAATLDNGIQVFDLPALPPPPGRRTFIALPWVARLAVRPVPARSPGAPPTPRPTADPAAIAWTLPAVGQVGGAIRAMAVDRGVVDIDGGGTDAGGRDTRRRDAVDGRTVWMGYGPRVAALALDDPAAPVVVGRTPILEGVVTGVAVQGDLAVAITGPARDGSATLVTLDVRDRSAPRILGRLPLPGASGPIALAAGWAFAIRRVAGEVVEPGTPPLVDVLDQVDVRDPARPMLRRRLVDRYAIDVVAVGDVVAASAGQVPPSEGDPSSRLHLLAAFDSDGEPGTRAVHADVSWFSLAAGPPGQAMIYGFRNGAIALDVRDPAQPREAGRWGDRTASNRCFTCPRLVVTDSGQPFVTTFGGDGIVRLPREGDPAPGQQGGASLSSSSSGGIAAVGSIVIAASRGGTVEVFAPDSWTEEAQDPIATLPLLSQVSALAFRADADDGLLYATLNAGGLRQLSMAQPRDLPVAAAAVDGTGRSRLHVAGGFATTLYQGGGDVLYNVSDLFDVRDPARPRFLERVHGSGEVGRVVAGAAGPWLVSSHERESGQGNIGVRLFDLRLPPPAIAPIPLPVAIMPADIAVADGRMAALGHQYHRGIGPLELELWDVSDLPRASRLAALSIGFTSKELNGMPVVALGPNAAFVASAIDIDSSGRAATSRLTSIDLTTPVHPRPGATMPIAGAIQSLAYAEGYLFAAGAACPDGNRTCVAVLDAAEPAALTLVGWLPLGAVGGADPNGRRDSVAVRGGRVYVAGYDSGIWVFEPPLP